LDDKTADYPYCLPGALRIFYCTANMNIEEWLKWQQTLQNKLNKKELSRD